jgi:DNA-binding protein HU-beta
LNRTEFVQAIAERSGLSNKDADAAVKAFYEVVARAVSSGDKITIPGFISFEQTDRAARTGRNPQTGEEIQIAATKAVKISAGSKLKAIAAGKEPAP